MHRINSTFSLPPIFQCQLFAPAILLKGGRFCRVFFPVFPVLSQKKSFRATLELQLALGSFLDNLKLKFKLTTMNMTPQCLRIHPTRLKDCLRALSSLFLEDGSGEED